ncbi:hypothetical protein QAD02_018594 [Eretmocerus hayati]|uniref:Uncharacterized protein n=1 Tax=Eretmocerus hayati TaxID=131215 RepID=A0ACC2PH59_9HYME|nr:hypothetical protein QAD02_018594 [Eretmocerus hayati]
MRLQKLSNTARRIIAQAIECHTKITQDHLTPELKLRLLTPDCPLYNCHPDDLPDDFRGSDPFWSIYWPGGQALARFVLDERRMFDGAKILDVGSGCGAAAIAAKLVGAVDALANDIDPVACIAVEMNAHLNGVEIRTSADNLIGHKLPETFDLVLLGDLLYDEILADEIKAWLDEHLIREKRAPQVYIADPGRHGLTPKLRSRLSHVRTYRLTESGRRENPGYDEVSVFEFLSPS